MNALRSAASMAYSGQCSVMDFSKCSTGSVPGLKLEPKVS